MSKELEALNDLNDENIVYVHKDYWNEIQKKLKALEIVKEKEVNVFIFLHSGDLETYNDMCETEEEKITQEEYELLKEMLE